MGTRTIRIPKNGTLLNLYIAVDVSDSIEEDYIKNATRAVKQLITKVRWRIILCPPISKCALERGGVWKVSKVRGDVRVAWRRSRGLWEHMRGLCLVPCTAGASFLSTWTSNQKQVVTQGCVALIEENGTAFIVMIGMYDEIRSSDFRANQHYTENTAREN